MIIIIIMNATKHLATSFKMGNFKQLVGTEEHLLFLVACLRSCAGIEKEGEKAISWI